MNYIIYAHAQAAIFQFNLVHDKTMNSSYISPSKDKMKCSEVQELLSRPKSGNHKDCYNINIFLPNMVNACLNRTN